ncbi:MAG: aminoacetone oxidase family FAD-binding enzyme [Clostridia bacterium]|nr:aminoacetone oxidase family FAD-binding enzyme [Clostridia bacterium]
MWDLLIVGGGAAGLSAAVAAASLGDRVLVLERMDRVGKKLLATGNGRCNLMNKLDRRYPAGETLAGAVLDQFGPRDQEAFWQWMGLRLRQEDQGRVYPASLQASTVLDVLRFQMERLGVQVRCSCKVEKIWEEQGLWHASIGDEVLSGKRLLVCGGGQAQPKLGSNGSCYGLLQDLGLKVSGPSPALSQVETDTRPIRGLDGIRVKSRVRVFREQKEIYSDTGEVLFTSYGLSGVCIMNASEFCALGKTEISLDLLSPMGLDAARMAGELRRRRDSWGGQMCEQLLCGICVPRLSMCLIKKSGIPVKADIGILTDRSLEKLVREMEDFRLCVHGIRGFDMCQVTKGGLAVSQVQPGNMEIRGKAGLHAAGEVLDVHGSCGGYNLMFAFAGGILAGLNGRSPVWKERGL